MKWSIVPEAQKIACPFDGPYIFRRTRGTFLVRPENTEQEKGSLKEVKKLRLSAA